MNNWQHISKKLEKVYIDENIYEKFVDDEKYLRNAFEVTERLWKEQFDRLKTINVIMISESSLFGDIHKYIYNKNTKPSSFFYYKDLEAFPTFNNIKKPNSTQEQKEIMLNEFIKNGFLILDLFPFSLNEKDTTINYRKMSKKLYKKLLEISRDHYLIPKLKVCLEKSTKNTKYIYRYKRLKGKIGDHFKEILKKVSNQEIEYEIDTINSENMWLNRSELKRILWK